MSDIAQKKARTTEEVLGLPYILDGRPWQQRLQDQAREMPRLGGKMLLVHRGVGGLLVKYGLSGSVASPAELREELLARDPLTLRGLGRQLLQLHNSKRLQRVRGKAVPAPGCAVEMVEFGVICAGRTEDKQSIGRHLEMAGFLAMKGRRGVNYNYVNEVLPADAQDYMDVYPPALPPREGEATATVLSRTYGVASASIIDVMERKRSSRAIGVVRHIVNYGEVLCYDKAEFAWLTNTK